MNAQPAILQPSYPGCSTSITDSTAVTTTTTTTTTATTLPAVSVQSSLKSRPVGWHAKTLGYEWGGRADGHRYRQSTGLPEVHATIINHDWALAAELLCQQDIGMLWLPTRSQRNSATEEKTTESGAWASTLPSKNQLTRMEAIRQMAIDLAGKTTVDEAGCLYGANLLTLCLQKSAPPEFMHSLIEMIKEQSPQYLNLPDASGRTPLYIAVERADEDQVAMLLAAGASPLAPCNFLASNQNPEATKKTDDGWLTMSAFYYALKSSNIKTFALLIENLLKSSAWKNDYPIVKDPLHLEKWASKHTEDEIRALAGQWPRLKSFLFNLNDKSGSSLVYRTLTQGKLLEDDIAPLFKKDPKLGAIYASALTGNTHLFSLRLNAFLGPHKTCYSYPSGDIATDMIETFLLHCASENIPVLVEKCESSVLHIQRVAVTNFIVEKLSFEKFSTLIKALHSHLINAALNRIAANAAIADERYWSFVINLPGFDMPRDGFYVNPMYTNAARGGNTKAFEFTLSRSSKFDRFLAKLESDPTVNFLGSKQIHIIQTLQARSLLWFEKYIAAGLDLQSLIDSDEEVVLPLMADLSPERLSTWLKGMTVNITPYMIDQTRTPGGRDALLKLIKREKAEPATIDS